MPVATTNNRRISALIHNDSLPIARAILGLQTMDKSAIIRAALALYKGLPADEARNYAYNNAVGSLSTDDYSNQFVSARVPDELLEGISGNLSHAIRVGLAMAAGMSRKEAEKYAQMKPGPKAKDNEIAA